MPQANQPAEPFSDKHLISIFNKALTGAVGAVILPLAGWSALTIAGGLMLATAASGGTALALLGLGAAAVGVQKTFSHLRSFYRAHKLIDRVVTDKPGTKTVSATYKPSIFSRNPFLRLAGGALRLGGGIALTATTGGIAPAIIGGTMILSGGASTLSGGLGSLSKVFRFAAQRQARKAGRNNAVSKPQGPKPL